TITENSTTSSAALVVRTKTSEDPTRIVMSPSASRSGGCPNSSVSSRVTHSSRWVLFRGITAVRSSASNSVLTGTGWASGASGRRISANWSGARKTGCWTPYTVHRVLVASTAITSLRSWGTILEKLALGWGPVALGGSQPASSISASCALVNWKP